MESCSPEVAIVVDPEFGDGLKALASRQCVWIAGSTTNRAAAEQLWRGKSAYAITTFQFDPAAPRAQVLADILPVVDEHHGAMSCEPPYQRLAVYGVGPEVAALAGLATIDFQLEAPTAEGFTAIAKGAV